MKVNYFANGIRFLCMAFIFLLCLQYAEVAHAISYPPTPPDDSFYVDEGYLIDTNTGKQINEIIFKLWNEKRIPIYVVTIPSLTEYGAGNYSIEQYATSLFNYWGIGSTARNYGILLLISRDDRRARIELGKAYGHDYDAHSKQIMQTLILPEFKQRAYANGILQGVIGLDALARGQDIPFSTKPWWVFPAFIAGIALILGIIISLFKSGRNGWGWALLIALGAIIWYILKNSGRGSRGGMGGGSSGGGGASGSW